MKAAITRRAAACLFAAATMNCPQSSQRAAAFDFDAAVAATNAEQREWCGMVKCVKDYPSSAFDVASLKASTGVAPPTVAVSRFTGVKQGTPSLIKINLNAAAPADDMQLVWLAEQSSGVVLASSTDECRFSRVFIDPAYQDFKSVKLVPRLYSKKSGLVEGKAFTLQDYEGTGKLCAGFGDSKNFDQEDGVFRFRVC